MLFGASPVLAPTGSAARDVVFEQSVAERIVERVSLEAGRSPASPESVAADGNAFPRRASTSRDGNVIAIERDDGTAKEIWLKDLRSRTQQIVVRVESSGIASATISADGTRIAYNRDATDVLGSGGIGTVVETAGGVPKEICKGCRLWGFMPDSRRAIATVDAPGIRLIDVISGEATDVMTGADARVDRPSVSPDGRWLAFRRQAGNGLKTYLTSMAAASVASAQPIDEPTITGRPAGWSPDSRLLYLLLDSDGFRCLWAQRVDPVSGALVGSPTVARHLHDVVGVSTSFGNAVTSQGFLYEAMSVRSSLWRVRPAVTSPGS